MKNQTTEQLYLSILTSELVPALGCTEPIAIALASAKAREVLGCFPEQITAACSGNIIKNVKGVTVPGTGNMKGIEASAIIGAVAGDSARQLEVLSTVTDQDVVRARLLLEQDICKVEILHGTANLRVIITAQGEGHTAVVEICDRHTNIVRVEYDGAVLSTSENQTVGENAGSELDRTQMSLAGILDFARTVAIEKVSALLETQIGCNLRIAEEGLKNSYGAQVGATLLACYDSQDVRIRARAYAAAGSDARMSGCVLPVVINSGSGNQGLTVSLPVIVYAKQLAASQEQLYRALLVSNLVAIHQKTGIGRLSAYCGAVSAACGAGAGIAFLHGEQDCVIGNTLVNTLANVSGIVCDGAKPSCAAKIASAVDAALLGYQMATRGNVFQSGEGIVKDTVEATMQSVGRLAREGMRQTDEEILEIMVE